MPRPGTFPGRPCFDPRAAINLKGLSAKVSTNETDTNKADAKEMTMRRTMLALFGLLSASAAMIAGAGRSIIPIVSRARTGEFRAIALT
jgi:hypothetical protein